MNRYLTTKKSKLSFLSLILILMFAGCFHRAFADVTPIEHLVWDKMPLNIILPVGKERLVSFPQPMQLEYDKSSLPSNTLRVLNNNQTLYLTAFKAFAPQRIEIKLQDSSIMLIDLSAKQGADNTPLDVVVSSLKKTKNSQTTEAINPISLLRFAEQQLYTPERLLKNFSSIFVVPMHTQKSVLLMLDARILATPIRSWQNNDFYVTSVELHNMSKDVIALNQTQLCGHWKMTAFFPINVLAPKGDIRDSTTAFLISTQPFSTAMNVCSGQEV